MRRNYFVKVNGQTIYFTYDRDTGFVKLRNGASGQFFAPTLKSAKATIVKIFTSGVS